MQVFEIIEHLMVTVCLADSLFLRPLEKLIKILGVVCLQFNVQSILLQGKIWTWKEYLLLIFHKEAFL